MLETPDGQGRIELAKFRSPSGPGGDRDAPANAPGIRHVTFEVDDLDAALAAVRARGGGLVGEVLNYPRTSIGSATCAAPRGSSSSSPRR